MNAIRCNVYLCTYLIREVCINVTAFESSGLVWSLGCYLNCLALNVTPFAITPLRLLNIIRLVYGRAAILNMGMTSVKAPADVAHTIHELSTRSDKVRASVTQALTTSSVRDAGADSFVQSQCRYRRLTRSYRV